MEYRSPVLFTHQMMGVRKETLGYIGTAIKKKQGINGLCLAGNELEFNTFS